MNKAFKPRVCYPYEEFADHIKAMEHVRNWEFTLRFGPVGKAQTSRANNARVLEYFSDCYENQAEAVSKAELFLEIYDYIGRHQPLFSRKGLLEAEANELLSVEPALLRAVHHVFTTRPAPAGLQPKKVLALAKALQAVEP